MIFDCVGDKTKPVAVLLNGSFTSGKTLVPIAESISDMYYCIVPTYDGHHKDGGEFTTREAQVQKILDYLRGEGIHELALLQGVSMGAEVALDLAAAIYKSDDMSVAKCIFDGGPYFSFNPVMRKIMQKKFLGFVHDFQHGTMDEIIERFSNNMMVKLLAKGDASPYFSMVEGIAVCAPYMTDQSVRNESDACYTFDYPKIPDDEQKKYLFIWSDNEPAYKSAKKMKKIYTAAKFDTVGNLGHCGFLTQKPELYIEFLKNPEELQSILHK